MSHPDRGRTAAALVLALAAPVLAAAAPITYVHPNAPSCGGFSPCFTTLSAAIQNVDNGGSVVVLANKPDNVFQTFGRTGITIRGNTPSITISGGVNVTTDVVSGWTIRDLVFTNGVAVRRVAVSFALRNLGATSVQLGPFPTDTNAVIEVRGLTLASAAGVISILGGPGADIAGSITIADNVNVGAVNIFSLATGSNPAHISANITLSANQVLNGANIVVDSDGTGGVGNVTGTVNFLDNVMSPTTGALGIVVVGNATGTVTGPVMFARNVGQAVVVNTAGSTVGGGIGSVAANGNDLEIVEINAKGFPLFGPVQVSGNRIVNKGSGAVGAPYIQVDGTPVAGNVTIHNTTGAGALISSTSAGGGSYSGALRMTQNVGRRLIVDSRGGSISGLLTVEGNSLPPADTPDSTLTVRALAGGGLAGGSISGNLLDGIQLDIGGGLAGGLAIASNTVREQAALIAAGALGNGTATLTGNHLSGTTYLQGMRTVARFNRIAGTTSFVPGAPVDARYNWWGCNSGPGTAGCASVAGSAALAPWLLFTAETRCTTATNAVQSVHVLRASDGSMPGSNVTPGFVSVTTTQGSVGAPVVSMVGSGSTTLTFPTAATPTVSSRLDAAILNWPATCDPDQTTVALYAPSTATFFMRNRNAPGAADATVAFGSPGMVPLLGDWNGDGVETVGLYHPPSSAFYLRNSNTSGFAEAAFSFGPGGAGWIPIVGDWDGNGTETIGLYDPAASAFYLRNSNTTGFADLAFSYGLGNAGWLPLAGDWNGDGVETIGLYRPSTSVFYLRNSNTSGVANIQFTYGPAGAGWRPLAGDWDGDGVDTTGLYIPARGVFALRNANSTGPAEVAVTFGPGGAGWLPLTGDFDGPRD